jgi:hypothetical protein
MFISKYFVGGYYSEKIAVVLEEVLIEEGADFSN